ncbi:MAG TPA: carbohydrate porin, partial [Polyangia bacterium]|nr:carbohydrate porin [Polyangia bacterium]
MATEFRFWRALICTMSFRVRLLACAALVAGSLAPATAWAEGSDPSFQPTDSRVDMFMYGRMGMGWTPGGQVISGAYMNLGDRHAIGGRLEEGDYLEPGLRFHILKGNKDDDVKVDFVMDFEIWSNDGAILSDLANDYKLLTIVPEQAYVQAHNVFIKGLDIWLGSRLYRKNDVHIADYFYFNSLPGQGLGVMYKNLDTAILVNTGSSPFFQADLNQGSMAPGVVPEVVKRIRTIFVAQYKYPFGHRSSYVQGLGEFHVVPRLQDAAHVAPNGLDPQDWGWVLGAKAHFDLGRDQFNDMSFRYGTRIANGAASGRTTYDTFGDTALDGTYKGAYGIEVVDHFMWNVGHIFSLNGYGTLHYNRGALDYVPAAAAVGGPPPVVGPNTRLDFAVGARPVVYLHKMFQLMAEATYQ